MKLRFLTSLGLIFFLTTTSGQGNASKNLHEKIPALLYARDITYDQELGLITARGEVEIEHEGRLLEADVVTYNEKTDTATATGHVRLRQETGEILFADYVELDSDFTAGFSKHVRVLLEDNARFTARKGKKKNKDLTEFEQATYSPCDLCKGQSPVWQLRAQHVERDTQEQNLTYTDGHMEMFGLPVFYVPYASTPLKRKSGLLFPSFGFTPDLGFFGALPYYGIIDESADVTITPYVFSKQAPLLGLEARKHFNFGEMQVSGSITRPNKTKEDAAKEDTVYEKKMRGHIFAEGKFSINDNWRSGIDILRATDQTYLKRYPFFGHSSDPYLTSKLFGEYFSGRDYGSVFGYSFQGLRAADRDRRTPLILPVADYHYVSEQRRWGDYLTADMNVFALSRGEGSNVKRAVLEAGWHLPYITDNGHAFLLTTSLRGDGYYVNYHGLETLTADQKEGAIGRAFPQASLEWRYPLLSLHQDHQVIIEPIAQVVGAPHGKNLKTIPNEDSSGFEFSDTNVFSINRIPGYDRIDSGTRTNYGFQIQHQSTSWGANTLMLGQSYAFTEPQAFFQGSGADEKLSDYVGRLSIVPLDYLSLTHRFRADHHTLKRKLSQTTLSVGPAIFKVGVDYVFVNKEAGTSDGRDLEQANLGLSSQMTKFWSATISHRRDLRSRKEGGAGALSEGVGIRYQDECFGAGFTITRTFYKDRDVKPGTTFFLTLMFKNLGSINQSFDASQDGSTNNFFQ